MNLNKQLKESNNYKKVDLRDDVFGLYRNVLDEESNTSIDVTTHSEVFIAELYTEFNEEPFWIGEYVENMTELKEFRKKAEDLLVTLINNYEL